LKTLTLTNRCPALLLSPLPSPLGDGLVEGLAGIGHRVTERATGKVAAMVAIAAMAMVIATKTVKMRH